MRLPLYLLILIGIATAAGCGGGSGTGPAIVPAQSNQVVGPTLGKIVNRSYTVYDLGELTYVWPGWFLSPGAASFSLNDNGEVVSVLNNIPAVWTTTSVTPLNSVRFISPRALNNNGQIVGDTTSANTNSYPIHAAIWLHGTITDLGSIVQNPAIIEDNSAGYGINELGDVVGESGAPRTNNHDSNRTDAIVYSGGNRYNLGSLGGQYCRAVDVNNVGQGVGYGITADFQQTHAISFQSLIATDLGTLPGGTYSQATALNDSGLIVGFATMARSGLFGTPPPRAVVWQNGSIRDIGTLGGPGSYATNVNNDGIIVGSAETSEIRTSVLTGLGYYYDYNTYYGIGSGLYGSLNSNGSPNSLPGYAGGSYGRSATSRLADPHGFSVAHAFAYADGTMFDLNKLLPSNSGWELTQAHGINAKGQIVGIGISQGRVHGFFLNPK